MTDFSTTAVDTAIREVGEKARLAFVQALRSAKTEFPTVIKTAEAGGRYRYADIHAIAALIDPILDRHKLSYRYVTDNDRADGSVKVTCILTHDDGWSEHASLVSPPDTSGGKQPIQALGSAVTYLQRYTLVSLLGLAIARDDDGAATSKRISPSQVKQLEKLCEGRNPNALLARYKIAGWEELPSSQFEKTLTYIKAKLSAAEKARKETTQNEKLS